MRRLAMVMALAALGATAARAQQDTTRTSSSAAFSAGGEEGWLGMGISCSRCSLQSSRISTGYRKGRPVTVSSGGTARWTFSEPPMVFSVEPDGPADRAGLMTGDTLVSIDGYPLTSVEGGERFASVDPGQTVTLRYRRDAHEVETRVTAGARPRSAEVEQVQRDIERARAAQQRAMEQSQSALERQREYMQRAMEQLQRAEGQFSDSTRQAALLRTQQMLDSAVARWRIAESLYAQVPAPAPVPARAPVSPALPAPPAAALAPAAPMMAYAPAAPLTYAEHRAFGPLRYSGQLGEVVIEARSPWAATATQVSDSEVVVTSRDLSVRIAIRPRATRAPRPAPAPRPARTPKPERQQI